MEYSNKAGTRSVFYVTAVQYLNLLQRVRWVHSSATPLLLLTWPVLSWDVHCSVDRYTACLIDALIAHT